MKKNLLISFCFFLFLPSNTKAFYIPYASSTPEYVVCLDRQKSETAMAEVKVFRYNQNIANPFETENFTNVNVNKSSTFVDFNDNPIVQWSDYSGDEVIIQYRMFDVKSVLFNETGTIAKTWDLTDIFHPEIKSLGTLSVNTDSTTPKFCMYNDGGDSRISDYDFDLSKVTFMDYNGGAYEKNAPLGIDYYLYDSVAKTISPFPDNTTLELDASNSVDSNGNYYCEEGSFCLFNANLAVPEKHGHLYLNIRDTETNNLVKRVEIKNGDVKIQESAGFTPDFSGGYSITAIWLSGAYTDYEEFITVYNDPFSPANSDTWEASSTISVFFKDSSYLEQDVIDFYDTNIDFSDPLYSDVINDISIVVEDTTSTVSGGQSSSEEYKEIIENLDPLFSLFTAQNLQEPLTNQDTFYSSEELGYSLSFTDPLNLIDSVDLMASSSCLSQGKSFVIEHIHVGNTGFSDEYFLKTLSLNIGENPDTPFKWWNPDFTRSPEYAQQPTCVYQTYLKFNFYTGGSYILKDNIYTVTNVLIQTGEGIFGLTLDLPLPERTPAFFLMVWNGVKIPFVDVSIGVEPFVNFLWSFIGQLFTFFINFIPIIKDVPEIIAPVPGESIPQLTNEFGLNWGNFSPAGNQVVYSRLGTQSTKIFDVLVRLFCFIWVFSFFFSMAFLKKKKDSEHESDIPIISHYKNKK